MKTRILTAALALATLSAAADPAAGSYVRTGAWRPGNGGSLPSCGTDSRRVLTDNAALITAYDLTDRQVTVNGEVLPFLHSNGQARLYGVTERQSRDGHRIEATVGLMVWTDGSTVLSGIVTLDGTPSCLDTLRAPFGRKTRT